MEDISNIPALRENIIDFERTRNSAISKILNAYDVLQDALIECHKAIRGKGENTISLDKDILEYLTRHKSYKRHNDNITYQYKFNKSITNLIDRQLWRYVIESTELDELFDKEARDEFEESLNKDCPEFTVETCMNTITNLRDNSYNIFKRGVANSFSSLDRRFKSHDGFKIGSRMIFDRAFNEYGSWNHYSNKDRIIRDVERAFLRLDNKDNIKKYAGIIGEIDSNRGFGKSSFVVETDYFRAKVYLNGNLHLWFKRDDLLKKVNLVLADYYGEVIGESSEVANSSDMPPMYHITPAKNFGYFPTSEETAEIVFERLGISNLNGLRVLEPSAGCGVLARMARNKGGNVVCVEIQEDHSNSLREQGFEVYNRNFLDLRPEDIGYFDVIIANPPFDNGRDSDHVRHMLKFLNEKGRLISIMSASAELSSSKRHSTLREHIYKNYDFIGYKYYGMKDLPFFKDLPAGSFKHCGTNVNTVTLGLKKKYE